MMIESVGFSKKWGSDSLIARLLVSWLGRYTIKIAPNTENTKRLPLKIGWF